MPFAHRHNENGTHDSICLECYRTIGTETTESRLDGPQREHACEIVDIVRLWDTSVAKFDLAARREGGRRSDDLAKSA